MIEAGAFVEAARTRGFSDWAGVPCSYLTPFINYVISNPVLRYYSCANEGDAVAISAGGALAGRRCVTLMQNSGLGNAVSPLTSLTWTFRLPQLLIITWRGEPGVPDEPQHQLMGPITPRLLEIMEIPWETFPQEAAEIRGVLDRAERHMLETGRPYALIMHKNTVAPYPLSGSGAPPPRARTTAEISRGGGPIPTRTEALARVIAHTPIASTVVLGTTGFTGRELYAIDDRPNQLYLVGSMGCVAGVALGLALARPDLIVVAVDGDGAALMRLGLFATVGAYGPSNLVHLLLDNGVHDSTGGQATVSAGVGFAAIAAACGYGRAIDSDQLDDIDQLITAAPPTGPRFLRIATQPGAPKDLPRPSSPPEAVRARLMRQIGA